MSTHAIIALKKDGIYKGCYVHFDGYAGGVGAVLLSDFNDAEKAEKLVNMGMVERISTGGFIGEWEDPEMRNKPRHGATVEELTHAMSCNHVYVYDNGWRYDRVPILMPSLRRDKKWKFKGIPLPDAVATCPVRPCPIRSRK